MGEAELHRLISGCLQQNRHDQKMLYKAFYGFAMSICLRYAGNRYEAAEIMNQGFLKVFTNLEKYNADRPFAAWIGRIMMNTSVDYYRSNLKANRTGELELADNIAHDDLPDQKLKYNDLIDMIQRLPNAYRTVFNLFAVEGYSHEEIAEMLGISIGTSKSNLFKAREKLKGMIMNAESRADIKPGEGDFRIVTISAVSIGVTVLINTIMQ
ncbi:RNA polymerase sigma factor [Mucilaginibacter lacusdianchii]|uniref:RNA polymerase sigma factor n=1 Tax=Mucilaginibacter lacusdianchii TaxID=2684211 RepID=UPI00131AB95A|nr:sigma-70 family RNA polymerase sigma factor [Mucilaginibacter sp. JXJ CY 39]